MIDFYNFFVIVYMFKEQPSYKEIAPCTSFSWVQVTFLLLLFYGTSKN